MQRKEIWTVLLAVVVGIGSLRAETNAIATNGLVAGESNQKEAPQAPNPPPRRGWVEDFRAWDEDRERRHAQWLKRERAKTPESQRLPGDDTATVIRLSLTADNMTVLSSVRDSRTGATQSVDFSSLSVSSLDITLFAVRWDGLVMSYVLSGPLLGFTPYVTGQNGELLVAGVGEGSEFSFGRSFALSEERWLTVVAGVGFLAHGFFEKANTNRVFRTSADGIVVRMGYRKRFLEATLSTSVLFGRLFPIDVPRHDYWTPVYPTVIVRLSLTVPLFEFGLR